MADANTEREGGIGKAVSRRDFFGSTLKATSKAARLGTAILLAEAGLTHGPQIKLPFPLAIITAGLDLRARRVEAHGEHPPSFPLEDGSGWHYEDQNSESAAYGWHRYPEGYSIRDEMWRAYEVWGREDTAGTPVSRPWRKGNQILQAFQKFVMKVTLNKVGETVGVEAEDIFDLMSRQDKDTWLSREFAIPPLIWTLWEGKPPEQVEGETFALLDQNPVIKDYFLQNPLWREQYGLPRAYRDGVLRTQKAVLRLGEDGQVNIDNGGEIVKRKTDGLIIPTEALVEELSERFFQHNFFSKEEDDGRRLPESVEGSSLFVTEMRRVLSFLQKEAPDIYGHITQYLRKIRESRTGVGALFNSKIFAAPPIDKPLSSYSDIITVASYIYHDSYHVRLYEEGSKPEGRYAELACVKAQLEFLQRFGPAGQSFADYARNIVATIDDPATRWWAK